jgi:hypothetical protein
MSLCLYCDIPIEWVKKKSAGTVIASFIGCEKGAEFFMVLRPGLGFDTVTYAGAFDGSLDETGVFEFFQVLGDGGLGQAEFFHKVAVDAGIAPDQVLDDGDPGGMGEGLHHAGQLVLFVGEYFGPGQTHWVIALLQYYDGLGKGQNLFRMARLSPYPELWTARLFPTQ